MSQKKSFLIGLIFAVSISVLIGPVGEVKSQVKYPTKAIDIIVPYSPGGGMDTSVRLIAAYLNKKWGVPVNAINKPGGNTIPANLDVYSSRPDGYTLFGDGSATSGLSVTVKDLPFKIMDRTFVTLVLCNPMFFLVPVASPIKSLKDLESEAKRDPDNFTWLSLGSASVNDVSTRQFLKVIGVDAKRTKPVVAKGGGETAQLLGSGAVKLACTTAPAIPAIQGGIARGLAITTKMRWPELPDLPTTAELGYPAIDFYPTAGISGPPKLPSYIVGIWEKAMEEMVKDPEIISKTRNLGSLPCFMDAKSTESISSKKLKWLRDCMG